MKIRMRMKRAALRRYNGTRARKFVEAHCRAVLDQMMERLGAHTRRQFAAFGIGPAARPGKFKIGDIVTRSGDDLQRVIEIDDDGFNLTVVCIKAPASGWCKVGDEERNLVRRYEFPADAIDGIVVPERASLPLKL